MVIDLAHHSGLADLIEAAELIERDRFSVRQNQAMKENREPALIGTIDFASLAEKPGAFRDQQLQSGTAVDIVRDLRDHRATELAIQAIQQNGFEDGSFIQPV